MTAHVDPLSIFGVLFISRSSPPFSIDFRSHLKHNGCGSHFLSSVPSDSLAPHPGGAPTVDPPPRRSMAELNGGLSVKTWPPPDHLRRPQCDSNRLDIKNLANNVPPRELEVESRAFRVTSESNSHRVLVIAPSSPAGTRTPSTKSAPENEDLGRQPHRCMAGGLAPL